MFQNMLTLFIYQQRNMFVHVRNTYKNGFWLIFWSIFFVTVINIVGRAVLKLRRLVAGFPLRRPGFEPRSVCVGFVMDKVTLGRFSPSTSVSPANSDSTNCSTFFIGYHPGLVTYQVDSASPHPKKLTKLTNIVGTNSKIYLSYQHKP
jgi:hypothetical protein